METKTCPSCGKKDQTDFSTCRYCQERYDYIPKKKEQEFDIGSMLRNPIGFVVFLVLVAAVFKPLRDLAIGAAVDQHLNNNDSAIVETSKRIEANPKDYDALIKRGDALMVVFHTDEALADYGAAIAARPTSAAAYRKRADAYRALGDETSAQKDLQTAQKLEH